jgi:PAS domain S-box-containing protein
VPLANAAVDVSALVVPQGPPPWFAAVLERSEVALVLVQADGVRYANPAARRLLAWDDGPLEGHQLTDWVVPEDRPRIAEQLRRRLAGEPGQFWEVQGLRRDGSRFDVRLCGQPVEVEGQAADLVTCSTSARPARPCARPSGMPTCWTTANTCPDRAPTCWPGPRAVCGRRRGCVSWWAPWPMPAPPTRTRPGPGWPRTTVPG